MTHASILTPYFPGDKRKLGRWLGVTHNVVQYLFYWIFPYSAAPITQTTVQLMSVEKVRTLGIGRHISKVDKSIKIKIVDDVVNSTLYLSC